MNRLTKEIKGANWYCRYELKKATYQRLFDLDSNEEIEDCIDCDLTIAIDKLGKLEDLEEELDVSLEDIIEFIRLLKKYYYVDITGRLQARTVWDNVKLNDDELYRINHIFDDIKGKSE